MRSDSIKISIIIPVYNMEKYIDACLQSVISQTLKEIEIICVDDGSTDRTLELLKGYEDENNNIKVIHQNRLGAGPARNSGIKLAKGKYIAFMDSDDYYPSNDVLEYLYDGCEKNGVSIGGGSLQREVNGILCKHQQPSLTITGDDRVVSIGEYPCFRGFYRFLFNRKFLIDKGIFFPSLVRCQDPPFLLKALFEAGRFWITSKCTYVYREFDKKIDFRSKNVMRDIAKGHWMMMHEAKINHCQVVQDEIIKSLSGNKEWLVAHVMGGNEEVLNYIEAIGEDILDASICKEYKNDWNESALKNYYLSRLESANKIRKATMDSRNVIIYGAGRYGKTMYDFISQIEGINFLGFAVTKKSGECESRGHKIRLLNEYADYIDNSLVIVAVKKDTDGEMEKYAKSLGFKNVLYIEGFSGNIEMGELTEGKFAFDNQ